MPFAHFTIPLLVYSGTQNIPGPPEDVHATFVNQSSVSLAWTQPDVDNSNSSRSGNASPGDMITGDELAAGAVDPANAGKDVPNAGDATSGTTGTEDIEFIVQYGKVNNMTMYETVAKLKNVSIYRCWTMERLVLHKLFQCRTIPPLCLPCSPHL